MNLLFSIFALFFLQAKGISVEDFLRKQEELTERFDSGSNGYRGLNGENQTRHIEHIELPLATLAAQIAHVMQSKLIRIGST
jgi:hypothetical protein